MIEQFNTFLAAHMDRLKGTLPPSDIIEYIQKIKSGGDSPIGDCDGFAVFLVALARTSGIPARCVYGHGDDGTVNGGGHVWVEAFYDGEWHVWDPYNRYTACGNYEADYSGYADCFIRNSNFITFNYILDEYHVDRGPDYGVPSVSIFGSIECPANLHAYDSQGRHVGVNAQGDIDLEISRAYYSGPDSEPESIVIFDQTEDITFKIEALDTGEFDFTLIQNSDTKTTNVTYRDVPITETTEATVDVSQANPAYTMEIDDNSDGVADREKKPTNITVSGSQSIFDTRASANPYPSLSGTHTGTITPSQDITVQKLYTYPCAGTGGHTESVRISGNGKDESASGNGYAEDGDAITFDSSFTLESGKTYNYVIITGSYPQIHHTKELQTDYGWLNCTKFTDANGKEYDDWIPAIRLGT